jgi:hypothetical protein
MSTAPMVTRARTASYSPKIPKSCSRITAFVSGPLRYWSET